MSPSLPKYLLFDLDGTLIDGVDDLITAMNCLLGVRQLAAIARPELEAMLGDGIRMLTHRVFHARGITLPPEEFEALCAEFLLAYKATNYTQTRLYQGVQSTLEQLHDNGWLIGLASNKDSEPCHDILTRLQIRHLFAVVVGGDAVSAKKPNPAHLQYALAKMGYHPDEAPIAVMIGDHANDVNAAKAAGIPSIAVALDVDATRAKGLGANCFTTDFKALPAILADLQASAISES